MSEVDPGDNAPDTDGHDAHTGCMNDSYDSNIINL